MIIRLKLLEQAPREPVFICLEKRIRFHPYRSNQNTFPYAKGKEEM